VPDLSGATGTNRADGTMLQIAADNDLAAVRCFLQEYSSSAGTHRIYVRECERLLLWAWNERKKAFSDLDRQDLEGYVEFLKDPQPAARWCGKKAPRQSDAWRPFVGPLNESALNTAWSVVKSCMAYLVDAGYLKGNPAILMRQMSRKMKGIDQRYSHSTRVAEEADKVERYFTEEQWRAINKCVESLPRKTAQQVKEYERLRFIFAFFYMLGARAGEMASHRMKSFRVAGGDWWWNVVGKGDKRETIPLPDGMRDAAIRYRKHLGLSMVPAKDDETPLLCSLDEPPRPITDRRLNQILKPIFFAAADDLERTRPDQAEPLRKASAHWGRHTAISRMDLAGMDPRMVQKSARHSDPRTTQRYIHDEGKRWHKMVQVHTMDWSESGRSDGDETNTKPAVPDHKFRT
jgi:integrase